MLLKNRTWRVLRLILILSALLMLTCGARAAVELAVSVTADPAELVSPGEVTLAFTLANTGDESATDVVLSSSDGLLSELIGEVEAGETQSFTRRHIVTAAELDAGRVGCVVSCADPDNAGHILNYPVTAEIRRCEAGPQVEFTRRFSGRYVRPGDTLLIVYELRNTGNVPLEALCVTDAAGTYTGRVERLETGASATLVNRVTMFEEDIASEARLSFEAEGTALEKSLTAEPVYACADDLRFDFDVKALPVLPRTARAALTLGPGGSMPYHDIRITDETGGGVIAEGLELGRGAAAQQIEREYALREGMSFCWRITGRRDDGSTISLTTGTRVLEADEPLVPNDVRLAVEALKPRINRAGHVRVRVVLENAGDGDVRNIALNVKADELPTERLWDFAILPAGGTIEREFEFFIEKDTRLSFAVAYGTVGGGAGAADGAYADIVIADDGVKPDDDTPKLIEFSGGSIRIGGSRVFAMLLITGVVILLLLIVMLIIASRRAKWKKAEERAQRRVRKGDERRKKDRT